MDYSKMSDYEISCEVGRAISFADYLLARSEQKNYCNSWADAGPIIEKHNISLLCSTMRSQKVWEAMTPDGEEHCWAETNPLRAAMIVFLMMHDKGEE